MAVRVNASSSQIILFNLLVVKVALGVLEITTVTLLLVPEHAVGSIAPASKGLLYAITLT